MVTSLGTRLAIWFGGAVLLCVVVLGVVAKMSSPVDAVNLSVGGAQVVGMGGGAVKAGIAELGPAYRVTADMTSGKTLANINSAKQSAAAKAKQDAATKKLAAQQKKIDQQQRDLSKLLAAQKAQSHK
jgi:hypothetical protein